MNKKNSSNSLLSSFIIGLFLCLFSVSTSFATQNKFSIIKDDAINYVKKNDESLQFTIFKNKKRIESMVSPSVLASLKNNFYSYALATRLFDENFYFSFEFNDITFNQNINLLESIEKPFDSPNYILHGNLDIAYSEPIKYNNYTTNYGYLSSETNSIYISETLANVLLNQFALKNYNEIVYSEQNPNYPSTINIKLKSFLDDEFEYSCKLRGVYKNSSSLAYNLNLTCKKDSSLAICSPAFFENLTFSENKLFCLIKANKKNGDSYNRFFNILENSFVDFKTEFDFSCNKNEKEIEIFTNKINSKVILSFYSLRWTFYILSFFLAICSFFFSFLFLKKRNVDSFLTLILLLIIFSLYVFIFSNVKLFNLLSLKSLFYSIPLLISHLIIVFMNSKINKNNYSFEKNNYYEIDI